MNTEPTPAIAACPSLVDDAIKFLRCDPGMLGELNHYGAIASAEANELSPYLSGRWFVIRVVRNNDGTWLVRIEFNTLSLYETPRIDKHIVDRAVDIETALLLYEPKEHIDHRQIRPRFEIDRGRFLHMLVRHYDTLVNDVLEQIQPYVDDEVRFASISAPTRRSGWGRLLDFLLPIKGE